ncbi:MAG TPA: hypothetical protein PLL93_13525 [bacterium]|nr:hypothetical protein [bacterium]HNO10182.1 hypothetical protein [bacterium]
MDTSDIRFFDYTFLCMAGHFNVKFSEGSGLAPEMRMVLVFCLAAFTLLFVYLLNKRLKMEKTERELELLYRTVQRDNRM